MIDKVYEIIGDIEKSNLKKNLDNIKNKIENDKEIKKLIKDFNEKKSLFENYNVKEDFIKSKTNLLKNEVISEYIKLQNEINLITMHINKRINNLTRNTTCK